MGYQRFIEINENGDFTHIYEVWVEDEINKPRKLKDTEVKINMKYKKTHQELINNHTAIFPIYGYDKTKKKMKRKNLTTAKRFKKDITRKELESFKELPDDFIEVDNIGKKQKFNHNQKQLVN